jgi:hypothetical protein
MLVVVDEPEREWRPGEQILVTLPDGQVVRCRVVNVTEDGTVPVVPENPVRHQLARCAVEPVTYPGGRATIRPSAPSCPRRPGGPGPTGG